MLLNVSAGGMLIVFYRSALLPAILEKVVISIETEHKKRIDGIEGEIVRIQAVDTTAGPRHVQYAVKFADAMAAEKKKQLAEFIVSLHH